MSETLTQFCEDMYRKVDSFEEAYGYQHNLKPEQYPLELPDDNNLWWEFFMIYVTTGEV